MSFNSFKNQTKIFLVLMTSSLVFTSNVKAGVSGSESLYCAMSLSPKTPSELAAQLITPYQAMQVELAHEGGLAGTKLSFNIEDNYNDKAYSLTMHWMKSDNKSSLKSINGLMLGKYKNESGNLIKETHLLITKAGKIAIQFDNDPVENNWFYCEVPGETDFNTNYKDSIQSGCLSHWCF